MHFEDNNFNDIYKKILKHVLDKGKDVNVRGLATKECLHCSLCLTDITNDKLNFNNTKAFKRETNYEEYYRNELEWYESGCLVAEHAPSTFWKKLADNHGKIQSNYGYITLYDKLEYHNDVISSYEHSLKLLTKDKFTRQAILHYNLPKHYRINNKDIPCTICTQVLIREDKINFHVFQRSCDLYFGLIYDLPWHCHLLKKMKCDLAKEYKNIECGTLYMTIGSVHLYEKDKDELKKILDERGK